ncbi:MAG TPA: pitrilysin family protein [Candidatus Binatia bacterium]|nr:pitrilysin family protein [Candidatus Binatia bacterium]
MTAVPRPPASLIDRGRSPSRRLARALAPFLILLAAGPGAQAAPLAHREVLPGGTVLLVAERPAIPIAVVSVYLRAGSAYDPADGDGLANLTASVITRGTARRGGPELDRAIEFVGGSLEAGAARDGATVSLSVLRKDLALGLELLTEVLIEPAFPDAEVKRRIADIQGGLRRAEQSPGTVASRALTRLLYPGHPYGHPVSGTIESVGQLTREQVVRFHRAHYRPDTAVVVAAGAVTVAEIRTWLLARLAVWKPPAAAPTVIPVASINPPVESRTIARDLTQATILKGRPAVTQHHPDYFPLVVANQILGGGSSSRVYKRVRDERGLAYSVGSWLSPAPFGPSMMVSLQTRTDEAAEAVRLIGEEMRRMQQAPVSAAELDLARSYLIGSFPLRLDTTGKVVRFLVGLEESGLGLDYPDRYKDRVGRVTAADVLRVAGIYFDPDRFSTVTVGKEP